MRVVVTGATGFIGRAVIAALCARGDDVVALSRRPPSEPKPAESSAARAPLWAAFDPLGPANPAAFEGADAVVHLAGETIAGRWSAKKKKRICDSRVTGTRNVVASLAACRRPPATLVSACGAGYYGNRGDEPLDESSPPGDDFLAQLCIAWEHEARAAEQRGVRVIMLRQGIVIGAGGGALRAMLPPFRAGIGGPLGSGAQWWPWIHLDDVVALTLFALDGTLHGPVNAVSPDIATNARFSHALGDALRRPALAYAPRFALRLILGEFADSLLASQLVLPANALDAGFCFQRAALEEALLAVLSRDRGRQPATQTIDQEQIVNAPLEKVFALLADPRSLERLTPPAAELRVLTPPQEMRRGATIQYSLKVRGIRLQWKSLVTDWRPAKSFADYSVRGPYELWRHEHRFEARGLQTLVRDRISYTLPLAPLSGIVLPLVHRDLARIFAFRKARIAEIFA